MLCEMTDGTAIRRATKNARRRFSFRGEEAGEGEGGVGPHRLVMDGQTRGASTTGSALRSVLVSGFVFLREGGFEPSLLTFVILG